MSSRFPVGRDCGGGLGGAHLRAISQRVISAGTRRYNSGLGRNIAPAVWAGSSFGEIESS